MITHLKGVSDSLTAFQRRLFDQLRTNPHKKHQQQNWKKTFHTSTIFHSKDSRMLMRYTHLRAENLVGRLD